ncbi:30S ribosomal protein S6 [Acidobacteria bacterium AH-259-G07]|nr:30S ribosomal protein S6 [Acidobacteria bacterium AH-259-G07]
MRRYEVVFVFAPTLSDDEVEQAMENFNKAAEEKGAQIINVDEWGKRRLAYPIKKHTEGIYTVLTLEEPAAEAVNELERRFKVTDSVMRFLSVRIDLDLKRAEKLKSHREKKKKRTTGARQGNEKKKEMAGVQGTGYG